MPSDTLGALLFRPFIVRIHYLHSLFAFIISLFIICTDEDPSLRIESSAIINLRGVSTKLSKYIVFTMQTYKKLNSECCLVNFSCELRSTRFSSVLL